MNRARRRRDSVMVMGSPIRLDTGCGSVVVHTVHTVGRGRSWVGVDPEST